MRLHLITYLKKADHKSVCHNFRIALGAILQESEDAPTGLESGNGVVHWEHWEDEGKRELANNSTHRVHGVDVDQFIFVESQVFFQACDVGIVWDGYQAQGSFCSAPRATTHSGLTDQYTLSNRQ